MSYADDDDFFDLMSGMDSGPVGIVNRRLKPLTCCTVVLGCVSSLVSCPLLLTAWSLGHHSNSPPPPPKKKKEKSASQDKALQSCLTIPETLEEMSHVVKRVCEGKVEAKASERARVAGQADNQVRRMGTPLSAWGIAGEHCLSQSSRKTSASASAA